MINAMSVKDRLKKQAKESGKAFQEILIAYGLERSIYRLSVSEYVERFTLKGGIFLYALFEGEFARATKDIDLLAKNIPNNLDYMKKVFANIFSIDCDDALKYDLDTLDVMKITEFKEYHGVNVSIIAYLDRTKIPVSVDVGFGDVIYPHRIKMEFPVLLDMEEPNIYAYSIPSVISEKFEAIVSLGNANSRYKDFYDIYILANQYNLDGKELKEAIKRTFAHRGTGFDDMFALTNDFLVNEIHQTRWKMFLKKKKVLVNVKLEDVLEMIKMLLLPIVDSIINATDYSSYWDHVTRCWRDVNGKF